MPAFPLPSAGAILYGSPPSTDSYTKSTDSNPSDRIDELQKFLLGSDWSSLSSLSPPTASIHSVAEDSASWPSSTAKVPTIPSSVETVKPAMQTVFAASNDATSPVAVSEASEALPISSDHAFAATVPSSTPAAAMATTAYPSPLTPPHRHSFDTCYSDSVGSPDSERDFLTSPSMFDDNDFEFEGDALANIPLFPDQSFEDSAEAIAEDPVSSFVSNLENVKLEAGEQDNPDLTETDLDASQSTVMAPQSQVKVEENVQDTSSTLDGAFKTEAEAFKLEPKCEDELDMWSAEDLKPYFNDEEAKAAVLSTLAHAFGHDFAEPIKVSSSQEEVQKPSHAGPIRATRTIRERRSSPTKAGPTMSSSASPAPTIDPVTKAKRWQCLECGKWFDRAYNLKTHRYTHEDPDTRARPFPCPDAECQKQFARKHDMQRHFENVHRGESRRAKGGSVRRSRTDDLG
ncbi:putative Transcriptional regulator CRZ1 (putative) [Pseudozyma hubeiensis]|nr:putative Transcriptional regulator CRZ1 (putative) [Pseudozyma hubeiensis]